MRRQTFNNHMSSFLFILGILSCFADIPLLAQGRDLSTERIIVDDNAGDGNGRHTMTIQTPQSPDALPQNSLLTIPDPGAAAANFLPSESLNPQTVNADMTFTGTLDFTSATILEFGATTTWLTAGNAASGTSVLGTTNTEDLRIITGSNLRMTIDDATGNVGIGTTPTALEMLTVAGTINSAGQYNIGNARVLGVPGTANVFAGVDAGAANTTGGFNVALGADAMTSNTEGFNNVAVGSNTFASNTTGDDNTAIGTNALITNVGGGRNSAVGSGALQSNTSGNFNTAMGVLASFANTTGNANTSHGVAALFSNTAGDSSVAVGVRALQSNTTGDFNTALGANAMAANIGGGGNSAVGSGALQSNTTGIQNAAVGLLALFANTTGVSNSAVGAGALQGNTTGGNNAAIGLIAGETDATGGGNTFLGSQSDAGSGLLSNATADVNVGIGTTTPSQKLEVANGNILLSNSATSGELRIAEPGGADYTAFRAGAQSASITHTLPTAASSADGEVLTSTTGGTMSWAGNLRVDESEGLIKLGGGFGMVLGDPDTDDDGLLDATGDATAVPFGTLRYDTSADKVQAFVSDSDGGGTDGWIDLH